MRYFVPLIISRIYPVIKIQPKRQQKSPPPPSSNIPHRCLKRMERRQQLVGINVHASHHHHTRDQAKKKGEYELESLHLSSLNISKSSLNLSPGQPNLSVCFVALLFSPQSLPWWYGQCQVTSHQPQQKQQDKGMRRVVATLPSLPLSTSATGLAQPWHPGPTNPYQPQKKPIMQHVTYQDWFD